MLLLLDNFEQVVEAAAEIGPLLERCPKLRLLVTSRELLRIDGEVEYSVPPLARARGGRALLRALASSSRTRRSPSSAGASTTCRLRSSSPPPGRASSRRSRSWSVSRSGSTCSRAGRDADARQQTLRATIEWSYDLLTRTSSASSRGLAVFRGGCTLEAAEEVAGADLDTLQSLVDKSLLRHTGERFWMLETIRAYAWERLDRERRRGRPAPAARRSSPSTSPRPRIRRWRTAATRRRALRGSTSSTTTCGPRSSGRAIRARDEVLLRLAAALAAFWPGRGFYAGRRHVVRARARAPMVAVEARMLLLRRCRRARGGNEGLRRARTRTWLSGAAWPSRRATKEVLGDELGGAQCERARRPGRGRAGAIRRDPREGTGDR